MTKIFGEVSDKPINSQEYLIMGFSPHLVSLQQRWRNNGLSADFLADYLINFFPWDDSNPSGLERQEEIKGAVSYVANELLENAMKFNDEAFQYPIGIQFQLYNDHLMLCATNSISKKNTDQFQSFIQELLNSNPQELYVRHMQRAHENEDKKISGLGLLTIMDDYKAKLGWKFESYSQNPDLTVVTTMAQLAV